MSSATSVRPVLAGVGAADSATMTIAVAVAGAAGRMGREVCRTVIAESDLELAAAVDPTAAGESVSALCGVDAGPLVVTDALDSAGPDDLDVVVDFTQLDAARENLEWCAANAVHAVVGTTGFGRDDTDAFVDRFVESNAVIAPNFAIGAVLMMRFAELAAPHFESAEIIELHHENKLDAPSGTAMMTARRMADASSEWLPDPTKTDVVAGARGGDGPAGIRMHSVRLHGLVAHQEVLFGTDGQTLTLRHDSYDRTSFMPGVALAVRAVAHTPGVTFGLDSLLGL